MLKLKKPYVYTVEDDTAKPDRGKSFSISKSLEEMKETADKIIHDYEHEFKPTQDKKPCRWCGYKFYCPRWE